MNPGRDPERRVPHGGVTVIAIAIGLIFWALLAVLLSVKVLSAAPESGAAQDFQSLTRGSK